MLNIDEENAVRGADEETKHVDTVAEAQQARISNSSFS